MVLYFIGNAAQFDLLDAMAKGLFKPGEKQVWGARCLEVEPSHKKAMIGYGMLLGFTVTDEAGDLLTDAGHPMWRSKLDESPSEGKCKCSGCSQFEAPAIGYGEGEPPDEVVEVSYAVMDLLRSMDTPYDVGISALLSIVVTALARPGHTPELVQQLHDAIDRAFDEAAPCHPARPAGEAN